jgi:hypothetical protein
VADCRWLIGASKINQQDFVSLSVSVSDIVQFLFTQNTIAIMDKEVQKCVEEL